MKRVSQQQQQQPVPVVSALQHYQFNHPLLTDEYATLLKHHQDGASDKSGILKSPQQQPKSRILAVDSENYMLRQGTTTGPEQQQQQQQPIAATTTTTTTTTTAGSPTGTIRSQMLCQAGVAYVQEQHHHQTNGELEHHKSKLLGGVKTFQRLLCGREPDDDERKRKSGGAAEDKVVVSSSSSSSPPSVRSPQATKLAQAADLANCNGDNHHHHHHGDVDANKNSSSSSSSNNICVFVKSLNKATAPATAIATTIIPSVNGVTVDDSDTATSLSNNKASKFTGDNNCTCGYLTSDLPVCHACFHSACSNFAERTICQWTDKNQANAGLVYYTERVTYQNSFFYFYHFFFLYC